jgi:hypothetical protein
MTIARTFIPDPPLSEHAQAPPSLARANLKSDENVWAAARRSYLAGCSTPVVAERHGLNERTVRRRAAQEGWAQTRRGEGRPGAPSPAAVAAALLAREPPVFAGEAVSAEAELDRHPDLEPFVQAHSYEVGELLLNPQPDRLSRFAFRRSAEAAAAGAATEALAWMRLVQAVERAQEPLERAARPFSAADYMRASYAAELRQAFEGEHVDDAWAGEAGMSTEGDR